LCQKCQKEIQKQGSRTSSATKKDSKPLKNTKPPKKNSRSSSSSSSSDQKKKQSIQSSSGGSDSSGKPKALPNKKASKPQEKKNIGKTNHSQSNKSEEFLEDLKTLKNLGDKTESLSKNGGERAESLPTKKRHSNGASLIP
jgi:hypothetical protein